MYKEQNKDEEELEYQPYTFVDYSPATIANAFAILANWSFHVKKQIDLKKEKWDFYQNEDDMINWIDKRYVRNTTI